VIGPLGAILAIPLSVLTKAVLLDMDPGARWLSVLVSPGSPATAAAGSSSAGPSSDDPTADDTLPDDTPPVRAPSARPSPADAPSDTPPG
jgi:AI-2 transport protein TqsA